MIERALEGLRVIDLTHYIAGPYCTKLLADCGADVIKVEPPTGDGARRLGPFPGDAPDPEQSALFLHLNTNKRGIVLDLKSKDGREALLELVRTADALVENFHPRVMPSLGLSYDVLKAANPDLVLTSISDFGQTGPYRDYKGSEIVDYALGGAYHCGGPPDRRPVKLGASVVQLLAGVHAAGATMAAVQGRPLRGGGDHVDISIMQMQAGSPDRRTPMLVGHQYTGKRNKRGEVSVSPVRPCKDGHVNVYVVPYRIKDAYDMLGMPELKKDPRFADPVQVQKPENAEQLEAILTAWLMDHTIIEVWQAAQAAHVISGPVYSFANLLKDDHFRQRGFWEAIEHPRAGRLEYPGRPFFSPGAPRVARRPAPTLGQHTAQVLAEVTSRQPQAGSRPAAAPEKTTRLPLEGIRVADLTVVLAGTNATTLLADWGAEVVRVEPINRFQPITRGTLPRPSQELINANRNWIAAYPGWKPGPRPWNCWPHFNAHARNKLSMTLNIERPGGLDVLRELVRVSDVVIENNVPETIDKLGIGYEALRRVRPDIVMIRMPAYGLSGPYANYRSLGAHLEGTAGHTYIRGYPDTDPSERDDVYFGDAVAAATAAAAVLMVLHRRQRTGEGCLIEAAQCECLVPFFGDMLLDYQMNGRVAQPAANDLYKMAPHNTYPCKGDDQWVAIAVGTEDEWRGLLQAMGNPAWGMDSRFATKASRFEHRRELDALVDAWTSQHEARWVMETLQARGVPCGVLNDEPGAFADPQLNARGFFETLTHADCGKHRYPGIIWRMAETPNHIRRPPCRLGEHNDWAYGELLGVAPARLAALREAGHIGMDYHPSVT